MRIIILKTAMKERGEDGDPYQKLVQRLIEEGNEFTEVANFLDQLGLTVLSEDSLREAISKFDLAKSLRLPDADDADE